MEEIIMEIMDKYGYIGILLLIAIENLFPPIPSEIILTFGGFATTQSSLTIIGVIIFATLGSVLGAILLYTIGRVFEASKIEQFVARYQKILRIAPSDIHKASEWFQKYSSWAVFLCRLVPLIRSLISIPAGMTRMNVVTFLLLTTLGSLIWNTILICVGAYVGESWHRIVEFMDVYSNIAYAIIAILFIALVVWYFGIYRKKKRTS